LFSSKFSKLLYLVLGSVCLALAKGDWPMVLPGFLFSYFLLRYTRSNQNLVSFGGLFIGTFLAVFIGVHNRSSFFPLPFYLMNTLINTLVIILIFYFERFFYFRTKGWVCCFIYPSLLTSLEFLLCFLPGTSGTWSSLCFSQLDNPVLLQSASLFGQFFVTFIVAFVGPFLNWLQDEGWSWSKTRQTVVVTLVVICALLSYGNIQQISKIATPTTRVAGITSRELVKKGSPNFAEINYAYWEERLSPANLVTITLDKTRQAINLGAKIIVWNEGCILINEPQQTYVLNTLRQMASQNRVYILAAYILLKNNHHSGRLMQNKAVMIDSLGRIAFQYRKVFLVPGVEDVIMDSGVKEIPTLDTEYGRIGTVICYDLQFPQYLKQSSAKKIDLLLVPGYEWPGVTPLATRIGAVEAAQNRTALLRITRGLSAAYDNYGRCLAQLNYFTTREDIFICDIPIQRSFSLYGKGGWIFPYLILVLTSVLIGWVLILQVPCFLIKWIKRTKSV